MPDHPAITRRHLLRSSLALGAFVLPQVFAAPGATGAPRRRARGVIVVLLEGGMSHLDTWDPKPDAPAEIRGEFKAIATTVPGLRIGEHMPLLAQQAHLCNVIRSVHYADGRNDHAPGMHLVLTGYENPEVGVTLVRLNRRNPSQGAVIARQLGVTSAQGMPRFVAIPGRGQQGGATNFTGPAFLGPAYDAFATGDLPAADQPMQLPPSLVLPKGVPVSALSDRDALRQTFDRLSAALDRDPATGQMDVHYQRALELLTTQRLIMALDLNREPTALRTRYGNSQIGQGLLLARRLVEAGATYVLVDPYAQSWDTHAQNFSGHRALLPPLDRGLSALLADLDQRGLLDEVLVLVAGEMGRTPIINSGAGRDHWVFAYSVMLAGGGLTRGQVLGNTTSKGDRPGQRPVTPPEILATIYEQLGINPNAMLYDEQKRPIPILPGEAKALTELIG
jgi:uncharacterized protein (DUF1501 family)